MNTDTENGSRAKYNTNDNPKQNGFNFVPLNYVDDVTPERRQAALDRSKQVADDGRRKLWQRADE